MKVVMIGAGNVATHLGRALMRAGHDVLQVYSRTMDAAQALANAVCATPTDRIETLVSTADVYIISVKDSVLTDLIPTICEGREERVMVHTAGSMPLDVFRGWAKHFGVLYPMQTFSKQRSVNFAEIPCFWEANDDMAAKTIHDIAASISDKLYQLTSEDRRYLHLSAVWACNFVNHCYDVAQSVLARHNIPFSVMLPLIDETTRKIHTLLPRTAQTGPAVRYDENVIRAQAELMQANSLLRNIYESISLSIHQAATSKENLLN